VCFATAARAQLDTGISYQPSGAPGGQQWTATAGKTVGGGNGVIQVEGGWPGIGFTYLRGLDDRTDVGLHVGFNYGFEGTANSVIGLNLAVPYRRTLVDSGATAVAFRADPGVSVYGNNGALVGIGGPVGVVAGWRMDPRLTVDVGADMPILLSFSNPAGVLFGPQVGAGAEYLLDRNVAVTFRARVGPEFALASGGTGSQVGFTTLLGLAYNTR
jgi:hypothetical protein